MTNVNRFGNQTEADKYFMQRAFRVAEHSDDPKAAINSKSGVGAVIVKDNEIVVESANILPPAFKQYMEASGFSVSEGDRYHVIEHAERAAIFAAFIAGKSTLGASLYCTRFPCSDCARAISWAGIRRVIVGSGFRGEARWLDAQRAALQLLRGSNIVVRYAPSF